MGRAASESGIGDFGPNAKRNYLSLGISSFSKEAVESRAVKERGKTGRYSLY
jgi:hypothetical protein